MSSPSGQIESLETELESERAELQACLSEITTVQVKCRLLIIFVQAFKILNLSLHQDAPNFSS